MCALVILFLLFFFLIFIYKRFSGFLCTNKPKKFVSRKQRARIEKIPQKNIYIHLVWWYTCFLLFIILFVVFLLFKATAQTCSDMIWSFMKNVIKTSYTEFVNVFWRFWWQFDLEIIFVFMKPKSGLLKVSYNGGSFKINSF